MSRPQWWTVLIRQTHFMPMNIQRVKVETCLGLNLIKYGVWSWCLIWYFTTKKLRINQHYQGDQRQGKSGRIREFQSLVFKSGKVRENGPSWRKSGKNQGISIWIREKIREFRCSIYLLFLIIFSKKKSLAPSALSYNKNCSNILARAVGARKSIKYSNRLL